MRSIGISRENQVGATRSRANGKSIFPYSRDFFFFPPAGAPPPAGRILGRWGGGRRSQQAPVHEGGGARDEKGKRTEEKRTQRGANRNGRGNGQACTLLPSYRRHHMEPAPGMQPAPRSSARVHPVNAVGQGQRRSANVSAVAGRFCPKKSCIPLAGPTCTLPYRGPHVGPAPGRQPAPVVEG